jgi:hypothetical protein
LRLRPLLQSLLQSLLPLPPLPLLLLLLLLRKFLPVRQVHLILIQNILFVGRVFISQGWRG